MGAIVGMFLFALALIAGPIAAGIAGYTLGGATTVIMLVTGALLAIVAGAILVFSRLWVKTKASMAFVRNSVKATQVFRSGGAVVVPTVHSITYVPLKSFRLEVERANTDSLITRDKLRADIKAEFFVRVQPDDDSILNAARSFGDQMVDDRHVAKLVEDKLVSALRTVAATKTLEELNTDRDSFVQLVTENVKTDLKHNGLTLESVTISKLDQTNPAALRDDNIFDAQGKRTIAEITQTQLTERKRLEQQGEQDRMKVEVETRKKLLELEQDRAAAEARQTAEIAQVQAEQQRLSKEKEIEAAKAVELANTLKTQAIEVAQREQQQAIEVAEQRKQEAIVAAAQKLEVSERSKQEAVAKAEALRAAAEAELATAEAEREKQRQAITTVQVEADAERDRKKRVISAEAAAQESYVKQQKAADAEAYAMKAKADGQKAAADAEAEAVRKRAEADAAAAKARAEGLEAEAMVPVNVKKAEVAVEGERVNVLQRELEARDKHGATAQEFELAKLRISKEAEVQIEAAKAMVHITGKVDATVFGTPEDVAKMTQAYAKGMGLSKLFGGFMSGVDGDTKTALSQAGSVLTSLVDTVANRETETDGTVPTQQPTRLIPTADNKGPGNGASA